MNVNLSSIKALLLSCLFVPQMAAAHTHEAEHATKQMQITFENLDEDAAREAREVIAACARQFQTVTGRKPGSWTVLIRFEDSTRMPGQALAGGGMVAGATTHGADHSLVRISTRSRARWQRVLAHEIVHALIHDAYGRAPNKTLNEGLAEYIAAQLYPGDVRRDLHKARWGRFNEAMLPYLDGYRFCSEHAEDPSFAKFFAREIQSPDTSYDGLSWLWNRATSATRRNS